MSKLSNYANASATRREENIAKVFAKLNTKGDFFPMFLTKTVDVSHTTLLGYLKTIQNAQMLTPAYHEHIKQPFESTTYANSVAHIQVKHARKQYAEWQKRNEKAQHFANESKQQLLQFQFQDNPYVTQEVLWARLEQCLLLYSLLAKPY